MTLDQVVIIITTVFALVAAAVNIAAARWGPYGLRVQCGVRGVIAALYIPAYTWLAFNPEDRLVWSQTVVGLSLFSWIAVWIMPGFCALCLEIRAKDANREGHVE